MKRSTISFSGAARALGLAIVLAGWGGGVAHAQEIPFGTAEPISYLPANLRKGVNLPYIFGNADHLYVKGAAPGPFAPIRLRDLLIPADFTTIKNEGFDHVRIPIDTRCFGVGPDGAYVATNTVPRSSRGGGPLALAQDNLAELKATIHEANAAGLAVIVDLHPVVVSEIHYQQIKDANTVPTSTVAHETVYLYDLTTTVNHPADANHPLAKFWTTFLPNFDPAEFSPNTLYFEILNEPMVGFRLDRYDPAGFDDIVPWRPWFKNRLLEWRGVQLNALSRALVVRPQYKYIASTAMGFLREFGAAEFQQTNGNWPSPFPIFGNAYSATELSGLPGDIGWQLVDNVIYNAHLYTPTAYTLGPKTDPDPDKTGELYRFNRDYVGVGHPNPNWDPFRPAILDAAQWMGRNQFSITQGGFTLNYHQAPIMMTEAGVNHRHPGGCGEPGMCLPEVVVIPPGGFNGESETLDRFWWHWDLKKNAAEFGMGWTVYEYWGQKGIGGNTIHSLSSIDQRGTRVGVFAWMREALFGNTVVTRRGF